MNQEFIKEFMQVYSDYLFPNEFKTPNEIAESMSNSKITNINPFIEFPFANPKIAKILSFFGCEIFYVWDKYVLKMYAFKVLVCLLCGIMAVLVKKVLLSSFFIFLMVIILWIIQKRIRKNISKICRKYNCELLLKALHNSESIKHRAKYLKIMSTIFFLLKDKEVRKSLVNLRDSFFSS